MTLRYTKILVITLIYIFGIMIQEIFSPSLLSVILIFLPSLFLILILSKNRILHSILLIALASGLLNTFLAQNNYFKKDLSSYFNKNVAIRGKVASHPVQSDRYSSFQMKIDTINKDKVHATIFVFIKPKNSLMKNDQVYLRGRINPPEGPANFGEIDYGLYYKTIQIDGSVYIKEKDKIIGSIPVNKFSLSSCASIIRMDIQEYIKKYYYPIQGSFLNALMLGARTNIPGSVKEIFIRSGTIHLLAISGLHVGIIALIFITIFINIGLSRRLSLILTLIILILYNFIIGYKPPILRSTIMFASILVCFLFDRDRNYLNNLALAALIILLFNPLALKAVSFQMSFLAAAGIIIFTPPLNSWIDQHIKIKLKIVHFFKTIFTASLSAQLLLLPLLLHYFGQFSFISLAANLLAIPMTSAILFLSLTAYFSFHIWGVTTLLLARVSNFLIAALIYLLNIFSKAPLLEHIRFNSLSLIMYLLILFLIFYKRFITLSIFPVNIKKIRYILLSIFSIILTAHLLFTSNTLSIGKKNDLEVLFFNINGKSILLKTPGEKIILIDAGYESDWFRHILPYLKRNRFDRIHYLILSNILSSRTESIPTILQTYPVDHYIDSGFIPGRFRYERIMEIISDKKVHFKMFTSPDKFTIDKVKFHILNPPPAYFRSFKRDDTNIRDNSIVMKIEYKGKKILLMSDIKKRAVKYLLLTKRKELRADIILLGDIRDHDYFLYDLLDRVKPRYAIVNKKFFQSEKKKIKFIEHTLKQFNIKYYFTYSDGAIQISADNRFTIKTSR